MRNRQGVMSGAWTDKTTENDLREREDSPCTLTIFQMCLTKPRMNTGLEESTP
jgi:hypothetical protein